jgi:hypothetical protein
VLGMSLLVFFLFVSKRVLFWEIIFFMLKATIIFACPTDDNHGVRLVTTRSLMDRGGQAAILVGLLKTADQS